MRSLSTEPACSDGTHHFFCLNRKQDPMAPERGVRKACIAKFSAAWRKKQYELAEVRPRRVRARAHASHSHAASDAYFVHQHTAAPRAQTDRRCLLSHMHLRSRWPCWPRPTSIFRPRRCALPAIAAAPAATHTSLEHAIARHPPSPSPPPVPTQLTTSYTHCSQLEVVECKAAGSSSGVNVTGNTSVDATPTLNSASSFASSFASSSIVAFSSVVSNVAPPTNDMIRAAVDASMFQSAGVKAADNQAFIPQSSVWGSSITLTKREAVWMRKEMSSVLKGINVNSLPAGMEASSHSSPDPFLVSFQKPLIETSTAQASPPAATSAP